MADKIYSTKLQDATERSTLLMFVLSAVAVAVGGIVEIVPLFYLPNTGMGNGTKHPDVVWHPQAGQTLDDWKVGDGVRPYKPLELAGRSVYIREGCYTCHSQMIRPFRDEKDRYGHYSIAEESMYDHPFQWGSKRTGPDLARLGGKYSDEWHRRHLEYPRSVVPESVMPNFVFLSKNKVDANRTVESMKVMTKMPFNPVPKEIYTDAYIAGAAAQLEGKTEMDAVIAYLQSLGNHVKFQEGVNYRD
ncbi:MAG: cytochrome-c oxidase, cbb3-type subunit II [Pseudomonadota bacterium]